MRTRSQVDRDAPRIRCGKCQRLLGFVEAGQVSVNVEVILLDPEEGSVTVSTPYGQGLVRREVEFWPEQNGSPHRFRCGKCGAISYLDLLPAARRSEARTRLS